MTVTDKFLQDAIREYFHYLETYFNSLGMRFRPDEIGID